VRNGGFESAVTSDWLLETIPPAAAQLETERANPGEGVVSALVTIQNGTASRAGVALQQSDISLTAGVLYRLSVLVRSTAPREIRVQVESASGNTYTTHVLASQTIWQRTFDFTAIASDSSARLRFEIGGSNASVWLDAISVTRIS
jgi:hypothetical protein